MALDHKPGAQACQPPYPSPAQGEAERLCLPHCARMLCSPPLPCRGGYAAYRYAQPAAAAAYSDRPEEVESWVGWEGGRWTGHRAGLQQTRSLTHPQAWGCFPLEEHRVWMREQVYMGLETPSQQAFKLL